MKSASKKFKIVHDISKGKTVCALASQESLRGEADDGNGERKVVTKKSHNHDGCGQRQPVFRISALKITAHFKAVKDEVRYQANWNILCLRMGFNKKHKVLK